MYSTTGTRLPPHRRRQRGSACYPRDLYVSQGDRSRPTGWQRPGLPWVDTNGGWGLVVRNAESGPICSSWVCTHSWCRLLLSATRSLGPAPGYRVWVVGRVVEVESIGIRGCTRRPLLDFHPAATHHHGGACCPRDLFGPELTVTPRRWLRPGCPQCGVWPGRETGWCAPMMGGAVVVRNAESSQVGSGCGYEKRAPAAQRSCCVAGAWCEVVGSAVTYSPTPSREQYHRRGRA